MNHALRTQLESYRDVASALDHRRAMECRDLEDWLDFGLAVLDAIRRIDARYRERVEAKTIPLQKGAVEEIYRLYEIWYASCDPLLRSITQLERDGYRVRMRRNSVKRAGAATSPAWNLKNSKRRPGSSRRAAGGH